jgi:heme exporter protein B
MSNVFATILKRDLVIAFLRNGHFFNSLAFFSITILLLISILSHGDPKVNLNLLNVILLPYIFAALLSASEIFQADFNDSTLEQLLISGNSSVSIVISKIIVHWLQLFIILLISVPLLCFIYNINLFLNLFSIYGALFLLSLSISSLVTFASALTLRISNGVIISCLIVMPLTIILLLYVASILNSITENVDSSILVIDIKILFVLTIVFSLISILACSYVLKKI